MKRFESGGRQHACLKSVQRRQASRAARDKVITNRYASILSLLFRSAGPQRGRDVNFLREQERKAFPAN
jgi:hypothetical protein